MAVAANPVYSLELFITMKPEITASVVCSFTTHAHFFYHRRSHSDEKLQKEKKKNQTIKYLKTSHWLAQTLVRQLEVRRRWRADLSGQKWIFITFPVMYKNDCLKKKKKGTCCFCRSLQLKSNSEKREEKKEKKKEKKRRAEQMLLNKRRFRWTLINRRRALRPLTARMCFSC